jgi:transposase
MLVLFLTEFYSIFDNSDISALDSFIEKYKTSSVDALVQFANGLEKDYDAVRNSLIYTDVSNGAAEARNSLTKMYHRRCRGRGGVELLQAYALVDQKIAS